MLRCWLPWLGGLLLVGGCCYPVRDQVDAALCHLATCPVDVGPAASEIIQTGHAAPDAEAPPPRQLKERLQIPPGLPGAEAPALQLPSFDPANPKAREAAIQRLYPNLPDVGTASTGLPSPTGQPLSLSDLQQLAITNNPTLRQAAAEVEAAKGNAIQAGLYPNPRAGYEADQFNQGGTAGMQGAFVEQTIVTAGKLKLAQAAASMDVANAELRFQQVQADVAAQVRGGYFGVLVAQENVRVSRALADFTDEVYRIQVERVQGGQSAAYEPLQLRVLAVQARADLVRARNRQTAAWKELAAALGLPAMPLTELAGPVDMPIPVYSYDQILHWVLSHHTDVLTAQNTVQRARYNLRLAQVRPVPDVDFRVMLQKDFTTYPFLAVTSVQVGMPVPVWDKNQGNIIAAQGQLLRASEEAHRVRNNLTARLAEAFERYDNNRILLRYYRDQILPDQVRTYRGAFQRHMQEPDKIGFAEVVVAQQTLATSVTAYVGTLGNLWLAVTDLSRLLQTNDLFQLGPDALATECVGPLPELPCCHVCSPLPDAALKGANGEWPAAK